MRDWVHFRDDGRIKGLAERLAAAQSTPARPVRASVIFRELFTEAAEARAAGCGDTHTDVRHGICLRCGTLTNPPEHR